VAEVASSMIERRPAWQTRDGDEVVAPDVRIVRGLAWGLALSLASCIVLVAMGVLSTAVFALLTAR
jgi:hypothetical protein